MHFQKFANTEDKALDIIDKVMKTAPALSPPVEKVEEIKTEGDDSLLSPI